jgi:hypothetical protein
MSTYSPAQATSLRKLSGDLNTENLGADPVATIKAMDARYSFSSTRVVLAALKKAYPEVKEFATESAKRRIEFKKLDDAQEPTEKQKEKFVKWEDIISFRDQYKDQMTEEEYLALCLYTMMPPIRADWTPMRVVARKPKTLQDGMNYLILGKSSATALLHAYKTHSTYGDVTLKIPKPLERVIRAYREKHPTEYLFDDGGSPYQPQRLGTLVRRTFQRFHGMDTGITMLRHAWVTHLNKGQKPLAELKKNSGAMLHGLTQHMAYRFLSLEE